MLTGASSRLLLCSHAGPQAASEDCWVPWGSALAWHTPGASLSGPEVSGVCLSWVCLGFVRILLHYCWCCLACSKQGIWEELLSLWPLCPLLEPLVIADSLLLLTILHSISSWRFTHKYISFVLNSTPEVFGYLNLLIVSHPLLVLVPRERGRTHRIKQTADEESSALHQPLYRWQSICYSQSRDGQPTSCLFLWTHSVLELLSFLVLKFS